MSCSASALTLAITLALSHAGSGGLAPEAPPASLEAPPPAGPGGGEAAPPAAPPPGEAMPPGEAAPPSAAPAPGAPGPEAPAPGAPAPEAPAPEAPLGGVPPVLPPVPGDVVGPPGDAPPPSGAEPDPFTVVDPSAPPGGADDAGDAPGWMTAEGELVDARPPPSPPPAAPPRPADGEKMVVAGGIIGAIGMVARVTTTIAGIRAGRTPGGAGPMDAEQIGAVFFTPLLATGLGLVGGGMGRRGHADAHRVLFEQGTPRWKRRLRLGWGLFGAGMGVWAITRLAPLGCHREQVCYFRTVEIGYYLSLAGTIPGIALGSYASGYLDYHKRHRKLASLSAAPMIGRDFRGVSLSARF